MDRCTSHHTSLDDKTTRDYTVDHISHFSVLTLYAAAAKSAEEGFLYIILERLVSDTEDIRLPRWRPTISPLLWH